MLLLSPSCMCDILRNHHDFDAELPAPVKHGHHLARRTVLDTRATTSGSRNVSKSRSVSRSLPPLSAHSLNISYLHPRIPDSYCIDSNTYRPMYMFREASGLSFESKGDRTMNLRYDAHATRWETALDTRVPAARFAHKTNRESGHVPSACPSHPPCAGTSRYTAATRRSSLSRRWPTAQLPSQRRPCRHRLAAEVLHHGALAGAESCGKVLCRWQTSAPARSRA